MKIDTDLKAALQQVLLKIDQLDPDLQRELKEALGDLEKGERIEEARTRFLPFVKHVWPGFIHGTHHEIMAEAFERVAAGKLKRLIINMPPRHTKSEFSSIMLPAWLLGQRPDLKIITATHTAELSQRFGRKVRDLIAKEEYKEVFSGVTLKADSKAAGRWDTSESGEFYAVGVGGALAGRGADLCILDDLMDEEGGLSDNPEYFQGVYDWYTSGPRQRLQPGGAIILVMTRWSQADITGKLLKAAAQGGEKWEVITLPALMPNEQPLWPGYWSLDELSKVREAIGAHKWEAQYQQNPQSAGAAIIKKEWWQIWDKEKLPAFEYIVQAWDVSFGMNDKSNYSACTTWGVFYHANERGVEVANIMLIDALNERLEFPTLKQRALDLYKLYQPDSLIIEAKSSGAALLQEMRSMGIPLQDYTPSRGNDKKTRVNAIADIFASGVVWAPEYPWAAEVIDQFEAFPRGEHDDLVDSSVMCLTRFRQGGMIPLKSDFKDDLPDPFSKVRQEPYY